MRRFGLVAGGLVLLIFFGTDLLTPQAWHWRGNNLQVTLNNEGNRRRGAGSISDSAGWSKSSLVLVDWWRESEGGSGSKQETTDFHIAGVSRRGVSVPVRYSQTAGDTKTSFDRVIFIPAHGIARVEVSPDFYLTGDFE